MKFKINVGYLFALCDVIIPIGVFHILFKILWLLMTFFIKLHVLIDLNKMGWMSAKIDILLLKIKPEKKYD